ncbi:MAG: hypothetical protein ABIO32_03765 [Ferruginibacter sp.]
MEVHKHPHHVTHKKKWQEYLLEFFMLFLAVFLGFVAENWREHIVEKRKEKEYMFALSSDLSSDTIIINKSIEYNNDIYKSDSILLRLLDNLNKDSASVREVFKHFSRTTNFWVDFNEDKTFEQLKSTGDFKLIKNSIVLDSMSKYYLQVARDKIFRDEIQSQLQITYNLADRVFDAYAFNNDQYPQTKLITTDIQLIKEYRNKLYHLIIYYKDFILHMQRLKQKAIDFISVTQKEYHLEKE